jgi:hypothetical protein
MAPKGGSASALVGDVQMLGSITISPEGVAGRQRLMVVSSTLERHEVSLQPDPLSHARRDFAPVHERNRSFEVSRK